MRGRIRTAVPDFEAAEGEREDNGKGKPFFLHDQSSDEEETGGDVYTVDVSLRNVGARHGGFW